MIKKIIIIYKPRLTMNVFCITNQSDSLSRLACGQVFNKICHVFDQILCTISDSAGNFNNITLSPFARDFFIFIYDLFMIIFIYY